MDSLLAGEGLPLKEEFFGAILEKEKANRAVLPVFLKQKGACVVTRAGFETMSELNPQLKKSLRVLAQSPNYVSTVICLRRGCDPELGLNVRSALGALHEDMVGKQLLMAFRIEEFQAYKPGCIQSVRALFERHGGAREPRGRSRQPPLAAKVES